MKFRVESCGPGSPSNEHEGDYARVSEVGCLEIFAWRNFNGLNMPVAVAAYAKGNWTMFTEVKP